MREKRERAHVTNLIAKAFLFRRGITLWKTDPFLVHSERFQIFVLAKSGAWIGVKPMTRPDKSWRILIWRTPRMPNRLRASFAILSREMQDSVSFFDTFPHSGVLADPDYWSICTVFLPRTPSEYAGKTLGFDEGFSCRKGAGRCVTRYSTDCQTPLPLPPQLTNSTLLILLVYAPADRWIGPDASDSADSEPVRYSKPGG